MTLQSSLPICVTCGAQYDEASFDPQHCKICEDERQFVAWTGQQWTSLDKAVADGHQSRIADEHGVTAVGIAPQLGIGQRALVIPGEGGNLLWDCVPFFDDAAVEQIERLGGLAAIAISHPHYYTAMNEWSAAFGDIPIYLHENDRQWVCRDAGNVRYWSGAELEALPGRTLLNIDVHFPGGTVLHWPAGSPGGALCTGDIFQVVQDRRWVSFMHSYPNLIPEHPDTVRRALATIWPYEFDILYGAWWGTVVASDAKNAVYRSAQRYLEHVGAAPLDF